MPYRLFHHWAQQGMNTGHVADGLGAGATVAYGVTWLADLDTMISIVTGLLVAISAGLSIFLHWRHLRQASRKKE